MFGLKLINISEIVTFTLDVRRKRERDYDKIIDFNVYDFDDFTKCKRNEC